MPEGLEVEIYRRSATAAVGRRVAMVWVEPSQVEADEITHSLVGAVLVDADRIGKHLLLGFGRSSGDSERLRLDIHFGMSGRLIVDGQPAIDDLIYSSNRLDADWDRLVIGFTEKSGGGSLRVNDPRRWARFRLEPAVLPSGVDLFQVEVATLMPRLAARAATIKSVLLDQDIIAGLGNMLVDEVLSVAGIDPRRPARELSQAEVARLVEALATALPTMLAAGGSHTGALGADQRSVVADCPRCGGRLERASVAGRATVWCRDHQH